MSDNARQLLAFVVFFALWGFTYWWLGIPGAAGFAVGLGAVRYLLGISEGLWIGSGDEGDRMTTELMRRLRDHYRGKT